MNKRIKTLTLKLHVLKHISNLHIVDGTIANILFLCFCPVLGDKESESGTVSVRSRGGKQLGRRTTEEVLTSLTELRDSRSNLEEF